MSAQNSTASDIEGTKLTKDLIIEVLEGSCAIKSAGSSDREMICERMTFNQLYGYSERKRKDRSQNVKGPSLKIEAYKGGERFFFNFASNERTEGRRHKGYIQFFPPRRANTPLERLECVVDCTCKDFRYRWAWAVKQRGSSVVGQNSFNQAWNRAPRRTNPSATPGLCIARGERVSTSRGLLPIEDVVVGDSVWTLDGWKKVLASERTGIRNTVNLIARSGRKIALTPEHPVYAFDETTGFSWIQAKDLTGRHQLVVPVPDDIDDRPRVIEVKSFNSEGVPGMGSTLEYQARQVRLEDTMAEILGYMVSEGSETLFCNTDSRLLDDFESKWKKTFGDRSVHRAASGSFVGAHGSRILLTAGYVPGAFSKEVPEWIFRSSKKTMIAFLRGAYAGDGNFHQTQSTYASVSEKLARGIHLLLDTLGVRATIDCYSAGIKGTPCWFVRTTNSSDTPKLYGMLNPIRGYSALPDGTASHGYHEHVATNIKRLFENVIARSFEPSNDHTLIPLNQVRQYLPWCTCSYGSVAEKLRENGKIVQYVRTRKSGKPNAFAKVSDICEAMREWRALDIARNISFKKNNGSRRYRAWIEEPLEAVRDRCPPAYDHLKTLVRKDVSFDAVDAVVPGDEVSVYDLKVEDAEHFVVNGVVVHNCKHLLALKRYIHGLYTHFESDKPNDGRYLDRMIRAANRQVISSDTGKPVSSADQWTSAARGHAAAKPSQPAKPAPKKPAPAPLPTPTTIKPGQVDPRRRQRESLDRVVMGMTPSAPERNRLLQEVEELEAELQQDQKVPPPADGPATPPELAQGEDLVSLVRSIRDMIAKLVGGDELSPPSAPEAPKKEEPAIPADAQKLSN